MFERLLRAYERGLDLALRFSLTTLCVFFATVALSLYLFVIIPKGFFPQQDNGMITAVSEMPQDISFAEMKRRQEELSDIVQADPAVDSIAMFIGGGGTALNSGRMYISLKPREARDVNAQEIIARLRPKLDKVEDARLYMQASQDLRMGGRATRTQFEYTLQDAISPSSTNGRRRSWRECGSCRSCATSPPTSRRRARRFSSRSIATPPRATVSSRN